MKRKAPASPLVSVQDSASGSNTDASSDSASRSSSSSSDNSGSDSDSEILAPPEFKTLPERATRGQRGKELLGSEAEEAEDFYAADAWRESHSDSSWETDNERGYRDEFDSDFANSSDEDEDRRDEEAIARRAAAEDRLEKARQRATEGRGALMARGVGGGRGGGKRGFDYEKAVRIREKRRQARHTFQSKSANEYRSEDMSKTGSESKGKRSGGFVGSSFAVQSDAEQKRLEASARDQEKITARLQDQKAAWLAYEALYGKASTFEAKREQKRGPYELFVSWNSTRFVENVKPRTPVQEIQMLFFLNDIDLKLSRIPQLYT